MGDILFESSKPSSLANNSFDSSDGMLMRSLMEQLAYAPGTGGSVLFNDVVSKLSSGPFADKARSWQSASPNISLSSSEVNDLLGSQCVDSLAASTNIQPDTAAKKIAQWLPAIIQEVTVFGELPANKKDIQMQLTSLMRRLPTA